MELTRTSRHCLHRCGGIRPLIHPFTISILFSYLCHASAIDQRGRSPLMCFSIGFTIHRALPRLPCSTYFRDSPLAAASCAHLSHTRTYSSVLTRRLGSLWCFGAMLEASVGGPAPRRCSATLEASIGGPALRPGFDRKMTKDEINQLPLQRYPSRVVLLNDSKATEDALLELRKEEILGFDTETRPSFTKGESHLPSLIQLTGKKKTFVFQLSKTGLPRNLLDILSDPHIVKAGVAVNFDILQLQKIAPFTSAGFVDLSKMGNAAGIQNSGLRGLAAVLLNFRISKQHQTSNWAKANLSSQQLNYAAMDSWVCRELYQVLISRIPADAR